MEPLYLLNVTSTMIWIKSIYDVFLFKNFVIKSSLIKLDICYEAFCNVSPKTLPCERGKLTAVKQSSPGR